MSMVIIYGKNGCPYTAAARKDFEARGIHYDYLDVQTDPQALEAMLAKSGGRREVPVIVENDAVKVGFGGT